MTGPVDTVFGPLVLPGGVAQDDLISRCLRLHGEWAWTEVDLAARLLRKGDRIWDVGAFLGTFGLGLTQIAEAAGAPAAALLAVEAHPPLVPLLTANLATNAPPCPHTIIHAAAGEADGTARAAPADGANLGATRFEPSPDAAADAGLETVPCHSLQTLRARHGDYDVLKLDIEGMEVQALRGDFAYLKARQPVIWAECNESRDSLRIQGVLQSAGYEVLYLAFPAFREDNFNASPERIFPVAYEAALVAAPPERLAPLLALGAREDLLLVRITSGNDLRRALWNTPRWGRAEWAGMTRPELLARLTRLQLRQDIGSFLDGDPEGPAPS
ncbi:MAG: FkbM family methyltransferase [Alterinioella nitratireducens]|uniref:FkbM family methyltransferase n=1 Tax=Alterinioella nitratireducens TaxID=2735915 RepID=UPI0040581F88